MTKKRQLLSAIGLGLFDTIKDPDLLSLVASNTIVPVIHKRIKGNKTTPTWTLKSLRTTMKKKKLSQRKGHVKTENVIPLQRTEKAIQCEYVIQEHTADKAGKHWDLRIYIDGHDYSFALPKGRLPGLGKSVLAVQQPAHSIDYYDFTGEITSGYGKGNVEQVSRGICDVFPGHQSTIVVQFWDPTIQGNYAFLKVKDTQNNWFIVKKSKLLIKPIRRMSFTSKISDEIWNDPNIRAERKRDGAHNHIRIKDNKVYITSHRASVKGSAIHIEAKIPHVRDASINLPDDTAIAVEVYHPKKTASFVGGVLNSLVPRARAVQRKYGKLHAMVFDVRRWNGKDTQDMSYRNKLKIMSQISKLTNGIIETPPGSIRNKRSFYERVVNSPAEGRSRGEGVVLKRLDEAVHYGREGDISNKASDWIKVKDANTWDKVVIGFTEGTGRLANNGIGAIIYSDSPNGKPLGHCGSGLTDTQRREMFKDQKKFLNKVVEIEAEVESKKTGALIKPRFVRMRADKDAYNPDDITHFRPESQLEDRISGLGYKGEKAKRIKFAMKSSKGWKKK